MDVDSIIRWFDPNGSYRQEQKARGAEMHARGAKQPPSVFVQYLVFSLGVFAGPFIRQYRTAGDWQDLTARRVIGAAIFSLLTGFVLFPRVMDSLAKPDASTFLRLSLVFTAGMGWEQMSGLPAAFGNSGH